MFAANFLFAFGDDHDVEWEFLAHRQMRFERLDVEKELAFVVDGAARENLSFAHRRLERRCRPKVERLRRLNLVVAVDQPRGTPGPLPPFADDAGRAPGRLYPGGDP